MKRFGILFFVLFIVGCSNEYETILDSDYSPIPDIPTVIQERAWSSPIWVEQS